MFLSIVSTFPYFGGGGATLRMYSFSIAAVANCHKISDLKQYPFTIS